MGAVYYFMDVFACVCVCYSHIIKDLMLSPMLRIVHNYTQQYTKPKAFAFLD